jgi:hypothetical protein
MTTETRIESIIELIGKSDRMRFMELIQPYVSRGVMTKMRMCAESDAGESYSEIVGDVIRCSCEAFGVTEAQLHGRKRKAGIVLARYVAIWAVRIVSPHSLSSIGRIFNRDHATCLHAIARVRNAIEVDVIERALIRDFCERMGWHGYDSVMNEFQKCLPKEKNNLTQKEI